MVVSNIRLQFLLFIATFFLFDLYIYMPALNLVFFTEVLSVPQYGSGKTTETIGI